MEYRDIDKHIEALEDIIEKTDELIQEGYKKSTMMVDPIKTQFISQLKLMQSELDVKRIMVNLFKLMREL